MREEIEARPSAILIIGLMLGLVALTYPVAFFALAGFAIWVRQVNGKCLLAGAFVVGLALSPSSSPILQIGTPMHGVGTVASVPVLYPDVQVCEFRMEAVTLLLTLPHDPGVMLGDRIRVSGIAKPPQAEGGSRRFQSIQGRMQVERFQVLEQGPWVAHLADECRRSFMAFLGRNLSPRSADLVDALCFNSRSMLDPRTREEMAQSGTVHIVSASGLQVFVFGALLTMLLRFVPVQRSVQILLLAAVLVVYALAAGLQPQIVRAAAMTLMGMAAYLVKRDPDALSALSFSGFAYLLWRPDAVFGMAFQLSFVTVACIALFLQLPSPKSTGWKQHILMVTNEFMKLSAIILLATAPLIAYYLGVISVVSVFANMLLVWSLPLVVGIAFCAYGLSFPLPSIGDAIAAHFLSPLTHWIYGTLELVGDGSATLQTPSFSVLWLFAFYGAWLMTYRRRVVQP